MARSRLGGAVERIARRIGIATDSTVGEYTNMWSAETSRNWPVAAVEGGYSRSTITPASRIGRGVWQFRVTANYASVIEFGGYRGVGPKTHQVAAHTMPGGVEVEGGIFAIQKTGGAPLRTAKSKVLLTINREFAGRIAAKVR